MMGQIYDKLLERALEAGLIKVSDLQLFDHSVSASSETIGCVNSHSLILQLIEAGKITQAQVDSIKKELESSLSVTMEELTDAGGTDQSTDLADPARYEVFELIGVGGMGQVYRARDKRLNRVVALKFINSHAKELINRFLLEAKAQARISHENICRVYEVGEYNGRFYISMQYIDGQSLHRLQHDITIQQAARIMALISEAIHSAHRYGFIHRDIKPSNVMCEKLENGEYKPYLVDFGLAREVGVDNKTLSGVIMGTPKYASPEQARGDSSMIGVRSDVYSLGATLYALLTGCPPFSGSSVMEIVSKVVNEDPVPARRLNTAIPEDLETIVMKCLEKEPDRRYDSAQALAEDLRLFLSGDPIKAKRASVVYVVGRKVRKHRAVVAVSAVSLLLLMLAGGLWLRDRVSAERLAQISQEFGRDVERIEATMRYSRLMPLHDTSAERAAAMAKMRQIRDRMKLLGSSATGPGNYALGQGYLVLGDNELARAHLELAWNSGYQTPDVAFALGQAYGLLYSNEADRFHGMSEVSQNAARQRQSQLRDFTLKYLRLSQIGNREQRSYADALIAFYEKRYDDAVRFARKSYSNQQWLYEALLLEGSIHTARASEFIENGQYQNARGLLDTAVKAFTEAARIGVSDEDTYLSLARTFSMYMSINLQRGKTARQELTAIESYCEKARTVNPASEDARTLLYYAYMNYAHNSVSNTEKQPIIEKLAEIVAPDYRLDRVDAQERLFEYHLLLADQDMARGQNYLPNLELAEKYIRRAIELDSGDISKKINLSHMLLNYAVNSSDKTLQERLYQKAVQSMNSYEREVQKINSYWSSLSNIYYTKALFEYKRNIDPSPSLNRLFNLLDSVKIDSQYADMLRGNASLVLAEYHYAQDELALKNLQNAIESYKRVEREDNSNAYLCYNLGYCLMLAAQKKRGDEQARDLEQAVKYFNKAVELNRDINVPPALHNALKNLKREKSEEERGERKE